jgi:cation transport ATPase
MSVGKARGGEIISSGPGIEFQAEPQECQNPLRIFSLFAVAVFFAVAVHQHLFSVNSEYYYTWKWQWIPSATVYPILLPLGIPFFLAQLLYARRPSAIWVGLLMVSALALMIGGAWIQQNPSGIYRIPDVIRSRWSTGYFVQAAKLL